MPRNPHFEPSSDADTPIRRGDLVLLDLWAKERDADSIYADLTWMAYAGERVPEEYARVFAIVAEARDAAVALHPAPRQRRSSRCAARRPTAPRAA